MQITEERIKHMHGVAEYMYANYDKYNCMLTKDEMYVLGLNHDIGYIEGKHEHEFRGAEIFARFCQDNTKNMIAKCIFHHGDRPIEYMNSHMCSENEIPDEMILLWTADMMVESGGEDAGKIVGLDKRLENIDKRYGKDSNSYRICSDTIKWLKNR